MHFLSLRKNWYRVTSLQLNNHIVELTHLVRRLKIERSYITITLQRIHGQFCGEIYLTKNSLHLYFRE